MGKYVKGVGKVRNAMRKLPGAITTPVNQASRFALGPMLKAAKRNVKELGILDTGELYDSLVIKKDPRSSKSRPVHKVGPQSDSPAVRYAHLQEFGVEPHGLHPGQPGRPFLTRAFEETQREAIDRFGTKLGQAVEKQAAKLAKAGGS